MFLIPKQTLSEKEQERKYHEDCKSPDLLMVAQFEFLEFGLELKVAFFSESAMCFSISKKELFQITILNLKFKFQGQDSFLEYFFLEI